MENFKHCKTDGYVSGTGCSAKVIFTHDRDLTWNLGTRHTPTLVGERWYPISPMAAIRSPSPVHSVEKVRVGKAIAYLVCLTIRHFKYFFPSRSEDVQQFLKNLGWGGVTDSFENVVEGDELSHVTTSLCLRFPSWGFLGIQIKNSEKLFLEALSFCLPNF